MTPLTSPSRLLTRHLGYNVTFRQRFLNPVTSLPKQTQRKFTSVTAPDQAAAVTTQTLVTPSPESLGFEETSVKKVRRPIYLDMQATTPVDPRVLDAMLPYLTQHYGNPHSRTHAYGWEAEKAVEQARTHVAELIGADPKEIVFTSGATESNNISVKGVARFYKSSKKHIITTQIASISMN